MSGHTLGPWQLEPPGPLSGKFSIPIFATVGVGYRRSIARTETADAEGRANARLIAAAPELLEALRELFNEVPFVTAGPGEEPDCECGEFVDYVPLHDEAPSCRHTRARAAIAKAEGQS